MFSSKRSYFIVVMAFFVSSYIFSCCTANILWCELEEAGIHLRTIYCIMILFRYITAFKCFYGQYALGIKSMIYNYGTSVTPASMQLNS